MSKNAHVRHVCLSSQKFSSTKRANLGLAYIFDRFNVECSHEIPISAVQLDDSQLKSGVDPAFLVNYQQLVLFIDALLNHLNEAAGYITFEDSITVDFEKITVEV